MPLQAAHAWVSTHPTSLYERVSMANDILGKQQPVRSHRDVIWDCTAPALPQQQSPYTAAAAAKKSRPDIIHRGFAPPALPHTTAVVSTHSDHSQRRTSLHNSKHAHEDRRVGPAAPTAAVQRSHMQCDTNFRAPHAPTRTTHTLQRVEAMVTCDTAVIVWCGRSTAQHGTARHGPVKKLSHYWHDGSCLLGHHTRLPATPKASTRYPL